MKSSIYVLLLIFSLARLEAAPRRCKLLLTYLSKVEFTPENSSAVELELKLGKNEMGLLTTEDGTVDSVLRGLNVPEWLEGGTEKGREVLWDSLTLKQKRELLGYAGRERGGAKTFYDNRRIPGVKVRDAIEINFPEDTTLFGETYKKGRHWVQTGLLFKAVEYKSPKAVETGSGTELHIRAGGKKDGSGLNAGEVSRDAAKLLELVGITPPHQHVHIVAKLPVALLEEKGDLQVGLMSDFYRRANIAAEMMSIVEYGGAIKTKKAEDGTWYFGPMRDNSLPYIENYFREVSQGHFPPLGDRFKQGFVGFRGADKYDSNTALWGLEFRKIPKEGIVNRDANERMLSNIQNAMEKNQFGISDKDMQTYFDQHGGPQRALSLISMQYYNQTLGSLEVYAGKAVTKALGIYRKPGEDYPPIYLKLKEVMAEHNEVKMLVHNWSRDPLIFNNPEAVKQVEDAQVAALQKFDAGEDINKTMKTFLKDSGLYQRVLKSIGSHQEQSQEN